MRKQKLIFTRFVDFIKSYNEKKKKRIETNSNTICSRKKKL